MPDAVSYALAVAAYRSTTVTGTESASVTVVALVDARDRLRHWEMPARAGLPADASMVGSPCATWSCAASSRRTPEREVALLPVYAMPDALWSRVVTILETVDPTPPAGARALLDALIYHALTDTALEALPSGYPSPREVRAAIERWRRLGLFHQLAHALHAPWDA
jgi:hypothetical protein